ncbi:MAG: hypothetical protein ACJAS1_007241 [Oleiphilaceae bacterium]|jgi:hypothetical protein
MSFDKDTNTITLDANSDFLVDSGVFFIHMLRKTALAADAPTKRLDDWKVIENWLDCKGGNITTVEEEKIGKGWKAYLAIGLAPSFKLQEAFDSYSKRYKEFNYSFKDDKPPTEVMDVFDKLLATDKEITAKKNHDWTEEKKKWEAVLNKSPKKKRTFKQRLSSLSKNSRVSIAGSAAWFVWVVFRSSDDWEVLGIYLDNWDEDMFFVNFALPILGVWLAFKTYKWVAGASK